MGQELYLLSAPIFKRAEITLGSSGNFLLIEAPDAGEKHLYVKGMTLNGKALHRGWVRHHEIA